MQAQDHEITRLLASWQQGDRAALDHLVPLIRRELDLIARHHLKREGKGNCVQPSSLVQEAFLRLLPHPNVEWQNRAHFFAVASKVMRHVLVDHAREKRRQKRGGAAVHVPIDSAIVLTVDQLDEVVAIDEALGRLEALEPRKCQVFEMRFFGGLSVEETAVALGIAPHTVTRDWNFARAWLRREWSGKGAAQCGPPATD